MKLRCQVCEHVQEAEHLAVLCGGCGASKSMAIAPGASTLKPGEPVCGPSRVPITRPPEGTLRGPDDEPLEVTRGRTARYRAWRDAGCGPGEARERAILDVPVQCGRCGGRDSRCATCGGMATAPTEDLMARWRAIAAARAAAKRPRPKRRASRVARVQEPGV